ncbi:hypothetical protein DesfrDRAFT_0167 [Solidesulfovibrio fructosivorans JJ]]|uniref:Uncharacterized protein n=1 Tax=Solidesulfovibrio fructosivorans JJ] TaxID=596151 RepID=E1JRB8_SOLFR|nr:hypothetical protein [Solidesulfovibrio fructosivorans]EFL53119.1 hypothetical protein DesfrDRAFT_0167 [Solidesulfovibrio fructosivorans JJ]]
MSEANDQEKRIGMSLDEYERVLRVKILEEIKYDIENWAFKKFKLWGIVVTIISLFGLTFMVKEIFTSMMKERMSGIETATLQASNAALKAEIAAEDAHKRMEKIRSSIEAFDDETKSTIGKLSMTLNKKTKEIEESLQNIDGKISSAKRQLDVTSSLTKSTAQGLEQSGTDKKIQTAVAQLNEIASNSNYKVFVYHVDGQLTDSQSATSLLTKQGFQSSNILSSLEESGDKMAKNTIRIIYDKRGENIVKSIQGELSKMFPDRVVTDASPKEKLSQDVQVLFY